MLIRCINSRNVRLLVYNTAQNWFSQLPNQNWLCVLVSDDRDTDYLYEALSKIIDRNVCYVCSVGNQCERVHDLADEEIVFREVDVDKQYLPKHEIITTWHHDFEEVIWFSIIAARHDEIEITTVVILDMTSGQRMADIRKALDNVEYNS